MSAKGKMADWSADDLERAAKYMRELDSSKNAKSAIELARREQDVEIQVSKTKEKEHEVSRANAAIGLERVRQEEFRKNQEHKRESEKVCPPAACCVRAQGGSHPWGGSGAPANHPHSHFPPA